MKVYQVVYCESVSQSTKGLFLTQELAEKFITQDIKRSYEHLFGENLKIDLYHKHYYITPFEVIEE